MLFVRTARPRRATVAEQISTIYHQSNEVNEGKTCLGMPSSRRAFLLSSGALLTSTSGAIATTRPGSSGPGSLRRSDTSEDRNAELSEQQTVAAVTGAWAAYKHDAANTGYAPETTGPRESVETLWTQPLDRAIYSSPAVADGRVFVGTYSYDESAGSIMAFDAATGEQQWALETGRIHSSAPTVADGTLYINSGGLDNPGLVHAVDVATGAVQWTHEFAGSERIRSSPTVRDGVVYATAEIGTDVEGETDVDVHALAADTGELLWSVTIDHAALEYSSPAVADGTVYHRVIDECDGDTGLYAFDAATGEIEWTAQGASMTGSPTVVDGTLYHSTAGHFGGSVARDAATGEIVWKTERGQDARFGPAVADGAVYGTTSDPGSAFALDAASGDLLWEFDSGEARGSPVVDADTVYVPSWGEERIYALDAADGTERWHVDLESRPYQPPAVVDGTLFVGDASRRGGLYAFAGQ